ncbi:MAG: 3-oxoacyl-ACP synthase III [Desulfobacterales bacterium]|jgi:3-oxoacyl-[acyl-carrier-protein] synthase-3|nr:3-oxoacyl-ACP synthase III [Desulfobacterales bacterium]
MNYSRVSIAAFGYELPPDVVTSADLEQRLAPLYAALRLQRGQLEAITGIQERRYWSPGAALSAGAARAGRKALQASGVPRERVGMLIYAAVCRENLEPATACAVADALKLPPGCQVYDVSNACLGVLNGMVQVANAIELGQVEAGLVVACESAREIVDLTVERLLREKSMEVLRKTIATLTGGSGAVGVLLADAALAPEGRRLLGGVARSAPEHHRLCTWGPATGIPAGANHMAETDSTRVLQHGVALGVETFGEFRRSLALGPDQPEKIICHQVGAAHQRALLEAIGVPAERDFTTFRHLGNIGTVSLPITAAIAEERGFLAPGDSVGLLGIGSGLNCLMLGVRW